MPENQRHLPENVLWTRADVMNFLRIADPRTLRSLEDDPTHPLPVHRLGGMLRYVPAEIEEWVTRSRCSSPDADEAA